MKEYRPLVGTFHALLLFVPLSVAFVVLFTSCPLHSTNEDSWQDYLNGATFNTRTPSLSPDGQYLVYASACTGHGDIYLIKSGANDPVRLTDSPDFESSPIFAADGKRIVYCREHEHRRHIWIMDSDGSNATELTQGRCLDDPRCVSRDGRYLLFDRVRPSRGMAIISYSYMMRVDEGAGKPISLGDGAVFSGDSRFVIYSKGGNLWRMDLDGDGGKRRKIGGADWPLDVSVDGKLILVLRLPAGGPSAGNQQIWVLDTETNAQTHVANGHSAVFIGPKSRRVLFFVGYDRIPHVTTTDGEMTTRLKGAETCATWPEVCFGGRGAVLGATLPPGRPDYDVVCIDSETMQTTTIASIGCRECTFQTLAIGEGTP